MAGEQNDAHAYANKCDGVVGRESGKFFVLCSSSQC